MNLNQLHYFVTLAHIEHYTRAAEMLSITQPSLSHAISMLEQAKGEENASEEVANEASETLQVLAGYTVAETQIENLVVAKGYADCVAFMGADSISVVVSAPDGLEAEDVAKIKDIVIAETSYTPGQIKIMEAGTSGAK